DDPKNLVGRIRPDPYEPPDVVGWGVGGPEAVPALVAALKDRDPLVRGEAALDLGQLGRGARAALPELSQALRDDDGFVRLWAAAAVARIRPDAPVDLAPFLAALRGKEGEVSAASSRLLGGLGP